MIRLGHGHRLVIVTTRARSWEHANRVLEAAEKLAIPGYRLDSAATYRQQGHKGRWVTMKLAWKATNSKLADPELGLDPFLKLERIGEGD